MDEARRTADTSCVVFMPFRGDFDLVDDLAIKPVLEEVSCREIRQDKQHELNDDKVARLMRDLRRCDLVIADISGLNPNVLWELGCAFALEKSRIILRRNGEPEVPFNIRTQDYVPYDLSPSGLTALRGRLRDKVTSRLERGASLGADWAVSECLRSITLGISELERNSILRNLVKNELERLSGRIRDLGRGRFDLRNEKPNSEIAKYFCDYVAQLNSPGATYDTVSTFEFWRAITLADNGNKNFAYLDANVQAAQAGAVIQRLFLIDAHGLPAADVSSNPLFRDFLARHYEASSQERSQGRMRTRVLFSRDYRSDVDTYENFAVWRQGHEEMLFKPNYAADGRMQWTDFYYFKPGRVGLADNRTMIEQHKSRFSRMWDQGVPLEQRHFGDGS